VEVSKAEASKEFVRQFFDAMNRGDVAAIVAAYAEDGTLWTCGNTLISGTFGKSVIRDAAGQIFEAFPQGMQFEIFGMVAEGDKVAVEARSCGLHISGREYRNRYHFLFELRNGQILRLSEYMDTEPVTEILCDGQRPPRAR